MSELYIEHESRVVNADNQFKHVMAIALDPRTDYKEGVIRCITSRSGDLAFKGNLDRSELHKVSGNSLEDFKIGENDISNQFHISEKLYGRENEVEILFNDFKKV